MSAYCTMAEADDYFLTKRINSEDWFTNSEERKDAALETATRYIDLLNLVGDKHLEDQELEFPRDDDEDVPEPIKMATYEIAFALITGRDIEMESEMDGDSSHSVDMARANFSGFINEARVHGIPSIVAWKLLRPFTRDGSTFTLSRTD